MRRKLVQLVLVPQLRKRIPGRVEQSMYLVCLDLEGVLVPEIWISVAERTGIDELRLTTRDEPNYDRLMRGRIDILEHNRLGLQDIQSVIAGMEPLEGAAQFLSSLREHMQVVILSDTFTQFASPLMRKLGWPTLFCNSLVVNEEGAVTGYKLRIKDGKTRSVEAFESIGFRVIAAGDSYNDIGMLEAATAGLLFRPPANVVSDHPGFRVTTTHAELLEAVLRVAEGSAGVSGP